MSRQVFGCAFASAFALTIAINAQTPAQQPQTSSPAAATTTAQPAAAGAVTVEGCLVREADVAGGKPSLPEKAGIGEDFIITSVKMVKGTAPRAVAAAKPGDAPVGTSGAIMMYRVEGLSADMLKSHVNKRVQLDGTFTDLDRAAAPATSSDLVDIKASAIRPVPGECPAK